MQRIKIKMEEDFNYQEPICRYVNGKGKGAV
jgi:hypothetical protein